VYNIDKKGTIMGMKNVHESALHPESTVEAVIVELFLKVLA